MKKEAFYFSLQVFILPAFLFLGVSSDAFAQAPAYRDMGGITASVVEKMIAATNSEDDKKAISNYLQNYQFARWLDNRFEAELPQFRDDLLKRVIGPVVNRNEPAAQPHLDTVFKFFRGQVTGSGNPPVRRFNALLLITELEQHRTSAKDVVPYSPATDFLVTIMNTKNAPDYLKVAALRGLRDHAAMNMDNAKRPALALIFAEYAFVVPKPEEKESGEVIWMRELAIEGLGLLGNPGAKGENVDQLLEIVSHPMYPLETRLAAASAIFSFSLGDGKTGKSSAWDVYQGVAKFAAEALTKEYTRQVTFRRGVVSGYESISATSSTRLDTTPMSPEETALQLRSLRQRVKAVAGPMYEALNINGPSGLERKLSASERATADKISKKMKDIRDMYDQMGENKKSTGSESAELASRPRDLKFEDERAKLGNQLKALYTILKLEPGPLETRKPRTR